MLKLNRKGQTLVEYVLIISLVTVIAIVTIVIMAFKIHILVGIFVLCAIIYWICRKLLYII